jgi:hypothetical protein
MLPIKPTLQYAASCPYCGGTLQSQAILWTGMHLCSESRCSHCQAEIIDALPIAHGLHYPYQVSLKDQKVLGDLRARDWLGEPLLRSLQHPNSTPIMLQKTILRPARQVIILNCIDFLYGHCLLKLLNAQRHLDHQPEYGLVVIVQKFLEWLVPDGVAEIWTVDVPLRSGQDYFPSLNVAIAQELQRFETVQVSEAFSHPSDFDIERFTKIPKHDFTAALPRVTFIWRDDRPWIDAPLLRGLRKWGLPQFAWIIQNWKVRRLLAKIRAHLPTAQFTVAGLGCATRFPPWIEDRRVCQFTPDLEREQCQIYSQSRLVIGIHGSNMLLPSGQAGMTLNLFRDRRIGNFAQDILYQESDPRIAAYRYRYLPSTVSPDRTARIAISMIVGFAEFAITMTPTAPTRNSSEATNSRPQATPHPDG